MNNIKKWKGKSKMSQQARKPRYIPLQLLGVEAEGFSYLPRQEILIHQGITVANGENGSGKTTFLNLLRVLFGATKFDNGHSLKTFFERDHINYIYIMGRFNNSLHPEYQKRPFQKLGKLQDDVTVVCRLVNGSQVKRDYVIFDGVFDLEHHLKENLRWLEVGQYLQQMELIGLSRTLANVFSFHQGNTEKLLHLNEEELADYLLKICGEQERLDQFTRLKLDLDDLFSQYQHLADQKQREELVINNVKQKIERCKQIVSHEKVLEENKIKKPLAKIKILKEDQIKKEESLKTLKTDKKTIEQSILQIKNNIEETSDTFSKTKDNIIELSSQQEHLQDQIIPLVENKTKLQQLTEELKQFIQEYKSVPFLSIELLNKEKVNAEIAYKKQVRITQTLADRRENRESEIKEIKQTQSTSYPEVIKQMINRLKSKNIDHLLLAEHVNITDKKWRVAIESLLGPERFTITVDEQSMIETMKIAQEVGYPYWISPFKAATLSFKKESMLSKIQVLDDRISGYLVRFKDYMISSTMEEAWEWVHKGYSALLNQPNPYQVIARGGRSLRPSGIYCSKQAYLFQLEQLELDLSQLLMKLELESQKEQSLSKKLEDLAISLQQQKMRKLLPEKEISLNNSILSLEKVTDEIQRTQTSISQLKVEINDLVASKEAETTKEQVLKITLDNQISNKSSLINSISEIHVCLDDIQDGYLTLSSSLSEEQKEYLDDEQFIKELTKPEHYEIQINTISQMITNLRNMGDPILPGDENMISLESKYNMHLTLLQNHQSEIAETELKIEKLKEKHVNAQEEYFIMVEEVFGKVKKALESLSSQGNINATLKLLKVGNEQWKIDYKIGFHGKEPVSYRTRAAFSGGQKVIISLLLTLAAVQADGMLSFMILDEPFAHLDQDRTELVSNFLKKTNAQYVIAMPYSENLKQLFPYADMSLNFRPKIEKEELAPPITYGIINDEYIKQHSQFSSSS
jgi:chromosome segregation protein